MLVCEKGALAQIKSLSAPFAPEGSEAVVITKESEVNAKVLEVLSRFLRLYPINASENSLTVERSVTLESTIRVVVGVGGDEQMQIASAIAFRYNLKFIFVATEVCYSPLSEKAVLFEGNSLYKIKDGKRADLLVCDTTAIESFAPFYGICAIHLASLLENEIDFAITGERNGEVERVLPAVTAMIKAELRGDGESVIRNGLSLSGGWENGVTATATAYTQILRARHEKSKPLVETAVVIAPKLLEFYRLALRFPLRNCCFVHNNNALLDGAEIELKTNPVKAFSRLPKYLKSVEIDKTIFCINSFKTELIKRAEVLTKSAQFVVDRFKRLYKDRGFSYNEYISGDTLRKALVYSNAIGKSSTLINLLFQIGYLR